MIRCSFCLVSRFMPRSIQADVPQINYGTPPPNTPAYDSVEEFIVRISNDGQPERVSIGKVYCPRQHVRQNPDEVVPFDTSSPHTQFALWYHKKKFKNRRRYNRSIVRRQKE